MRKFQGLKNDVDVGRSFSQTFFFSLVIIIIHKNQRGCTAIYLLFRYIFLKSWWWETRRKDERAQTFSVFIASQFQLVPTVGITPPPRVQFLADFHAVQVSKFVCCCFSIPLCSWDQRVMLYTRFPPPPFVRFSGVCATAVGVLSTGRTDARCQLSSPSSLYVTHSGHHNSSKERERKLFFKTVEPHSRRRQGVFIPPEKKKNDGIYWERSCELISQGAEPITSEN